MRFAIKIIASTMQQLNPLVKSLQSSKNNVSGEGFKIGVFTKTAWIFASDDILGGSPSSLPARRACQTASNTEPY